MLHNLYYLHIVNNKKQERGPSKARKSKPEVKTADSALLSLFMSCYKIRCDAENEGLSF